MNYYILPKNNFDIKLRLNYHNKVDPYISNSLNFFLNKKQNLLNKLNNDSGELDNVKFVINYLNNVFVSNTNTPVSRLPCNNQIYYELLEVISLCGIKDILTHRQSLVCAHISPNSAVTNSLFTSFRNNVVSDIIYSCAFNYDLISCLFFNNSIYSNFDILFFEFKESDYTDIKCLSKSIIIMLSLICKSMATGGTIIFKLENCFHKIVVDFIYILSTLFDKTIIIKPVVSNVIDNTKFFICKGFNASEYNKKSIYYSLEERVYVFLNNINDMSNLISGVYIDSILENKIPYLFINKLEEFNVVLGQQQIDCIEQAICLFKSKSRSDKLEVIRRSNIPKAIQWCEKFNVPYIKQLDKPNMFLKRIDDSSINNDNSSI